MLLAMLIFAAGVMLAPVFLVNKTVDVAVTGLQQMVHDITSGKLAMEFNHSGAKLNRHSHLDVCSFETLEIFTASDQRKYWPDIKVEGRVPVTYTYYIDLKKKIDIRINNGPFREGDLRTPELTITVPPIEWNPPALHTHKMVMRDLETSMLRSEDKLRQRLARSMYPACRDRRAGKYLSLIEQSAKESIREFMYTWFVQSKYANAPIKPIITEIIFAKPHAPILKPDPER